MTIKQRWGIFTVKPPLKVALTRFCVSMRISCFSIKISWWREKSFKIKRNSQIWRLFDKFVKKFSNRRESLQTVGFRIENVWKIVFIWTQTFILVMENAWWDTASDTNNRLLNCFECQSLEKSGVEEFGKNSNLSNFANWLFCRECAWKLFADFIFGIFVCIKIKFRRQLEGFEILLTTPNKSHPKITHQI